MNVNCFYDEINVQSNITGCLITDPSKVKPIFMKKSANFFSISVFIRPMTCGHFVFGTCILCSYCKQFREQLRKIFRLIISKFKKTSNPIFGFIIGKIGFIEPVFNINWQNQYKISNFGSKRCTFWVLKFQTFNKNWPQNCIETIMNQPYHLKH